MIIPVLAVPLMAVVSLVLRLWFVLLRKKQQQQQQQQKNHGVISNNGGETSLTGTIYFTKRLAVRQARCALSWLQKNLSTWLYNAFTYWMFVEMQTYFFLWLYVSIELFKNSFEVCYLTVRLEWRYTAMCWVWGMLVLLFLLLFVA